MENLDLSVTLSRAMDAVTNGGVVQTVGFLMESVRTHSGIFSDNYFYNKYMTPISVIIHFNSTRRSESSLS